MSDFVFAQEVTPEVSAVKVDSWKVLIVDDEPEVHKITKLVLDALVFEGKGLELTHAYSAEEAKEKVSQFAAVDDIAIAIIDVVMETDHAGLDLVKYLRNTLNNHQTRIILRTGQPGQAPEETVIKEYDINDYKAKTELTAAKLKTTIYAAMRSYRDIKTIALHRAGLQKVLQAIANINNEPNLTQLANQILSQVAVVLELETDSMFCSVLSKKSTDQQSDGFKILARSGHLFSELAHECASLPSEIELLFKRALSTKSSIEEGYHYIAYIAMPNGDESLLYFRKSNPLNQLNKQLLDIFIDNFAKAFAALALKEEIEQSQRELVYILGEAVELKSKETGSHVKRVGEISYLLARAIGLDEADCNLIKAAAPLHDVGKVSVPDAILNKPGKLDDDERRIMQGHTEMGAKMLSRSSTKILQTAAKIALEHHEFWNGGGYPFKKEGDDIHIMARITGLADVFDALGSKRCYKDPWPTEKIVALIQEQKGVQFDPKVVDALIANLPEIIAIREQYPDNF